MAGIDKRTMARLESAYDKHGGGSVQHLKALAAYELATYGTIINGSRENAK